MREEVLKKLNLPTGWLSFAPRIWAFVAKTYDIERWLPGKTNTGRYPHAVLDRLSGKKGKYKILGGRQRQSLNMCIH